MPEGAGAAVHIELGVVDAVFGHGGHRNGRECLIDFEQVNLIDTPAGFVQHLTNRAHRRGGKPCRLLRMGCVGNNACKRSDPQFGGLFFGHQYGGGRTVGNLRRSCCSHGAILGKRGTQRWDFFEVATRRLFITIQRGFTSAGLYGHGGNLIREFAVHGTQRALHGIGSECILLLAGECVLVRASLAIHAHHESFIGILQTICEHVVQHFTMTHAESTAGFWQHVGGAGHGFHATGNHHLVGAGNNGVMPQHDRDQGGTAGLVDRDGAGIKRNTCLASGEARRRQADAGRQYAAHDHVINFLCIDAGVFNRSPDGGSPQLVRGHVLELALEGTYCRPFGAGDDDFAH